MNLKRESEMEGGSAPAGYTSSFQLSGPRAPKPLPTAALARSTRCLLVIHRLHSFYFSFLKIQLGNVCLKKQQQDSSPIKLDENNFRLILISQVETALICMIGQRPTRHDRLCCSDVLRFGGHVIHIIQPPS